jgi:DNA polymerase sigma
VQLEGGDISEVPEFVLLDDSMVILHVDIIFDDYNGITSQLENPQSGNPSHNPFPMLR